LFVQCQRSLSLTIVSLLLKHTRCTLHLNHGYLTTTYDYHTTNLIGYSIMDKIDTQGMSLPGKSKKPSRFDPMPVKHRTIFTPEERMELKQIINEALDEREQA